MKKFLLGSAVLIALGMAVPASAADMAARTYTKAPPMMAAVYDWTGFYIGANGGYGSSRSCWNFVSLGGAVFPPPTGQGCHDADGATAGGQVGYRWQSASWVFGLEAQGNWADFRGSNVSLPATAGLVTANSRVRSFGLFTGQVGYAVNNALIYAKGGAAVTDSRYFHTLTAGGALFNAGTDTRVGATVGAGVEFGITPNWSIGAEYNHLFMDRKTVAMAPSAVGLASTNSIREDVDMVTARINYRWGGPVVARY